MKKIKNKKIQFLIISIAIVLLITIGGVYAATVIAAEKVSYDNTDTGMSATNMQDALDEAYNNAQTKIEAAKKECPAGYKCEIPKLCKRATLLHKEICQHTSTYYTCGADGHITANSYGEPDENEIITYGNLGTSGKLTTGDAFDCDVNGDGIYDATKERFYYVTDMDSNTAVLIYYSNVTAGAPTSYTTYYKYSETYEDNNGLYIGPASAIQQLPTTSQWSNVSLTNTTRNIYDETGTIRVNNFSYAGYAARLLTYQEVKTACYDGTTSIESAGGLSSKCKYLFENTSYVVNNLYIKGGYWLETKKSEKSYRSWFVFTQDRDLWYENVQVTDAVAEGVRPVIEVAKSRISY